MAQDSEFREAIMTETLRILGIAGSLRSASYSRALLDSIAAMLPASVAFEMLDIGAFPPYAEDLERTALPAVVSAGRAQVKACVSRVSVTRIWLKSFIYDF